jgi:hypothetical protein
MTPEPNVIADLIGQLTHNPWIVAYVAGVLTGWHLARRSTRYMLGGESFD